jgi:hypothetical protein
MSRAAPYSSRAGRRKRGGEMETGIVKLAPSIVETDFARLGEQVAET